MANADIAMYKAKEQGRDRFELFTPSLNVDIRERLDLEVELRRAVESEQFVLLYQPIVGVEDRALVATEALIRWQHPDRGLIGPSNFIRLAEETGAIVPIGDWVIRTACAQVARWLEDGLPAVPVSVNVSGHQLQHSDLVATIQNALMDAGLPPRFLHLEITEGVVLQDVSKAVIILRALREMGVEISIDDFGTGYSSLTYLKRLPVDSVKIDRSFIADLATDPNDAAIATAIIAMAHSIGLRVIAEGIETEEQLAFLRSHGCDEMQGFLEGRPVPAAELTARLEADQAPRPLSRSA
ncbi:MAG: EAL domain-containing protein [Dehalococcoidia bacterium]